MNENKKIIIGKSIAKYKLKILSPDNEVLISEIKSITKPEKKTFNL